MQRVLTPKDWEAYCKAEDSPLTVLHEDSEATSASDVMTKVRTASATIACARAALSARHRLRRHLLGGNE